ncbi:MAG: MBL fold metallo-hydrolase [Hyphomicrobium sp.]|nr:MBL fold metallo-hydrolase [Hyphomicrobium sp.]
MPTSSLVNIAGRTIILDCGLGVTRGLMAQEVRLEDLDTIIITHLHSDHYLELGPLIHTAWTGGARQPIMVYGPSGLKSYWRAFYESMRFDIDLRRANEGLPELADLVSFEVIEPGAIFDRDGLHVSALPNHHPPITESYAVCFETDTIKLVFSGDTAPFDGFTKFAACADLLVHEALLSAGIERIIARTGLGDKLRKHLTENHTLAEDVGQIASAARVGSLALHHLVPADDPEFGLQDWEREVRKNWSGLLHVGRDGMKIRLADNRNGINNPQKS